jgi:hypothetical protein
VKVSTGHGDPGTAFLPSISVDRSPGSWARPGDSHKLGGDLADLFAAFSDTGGRVFPAFALARNPRGPIDPTPPHASQDSPGLRATAVTPEMPSQSQLLCFLGGQLQLHGDNPDGETYPDLYTARVDLFTNARRFLLRRVSKEAP